MNASTCRRLDIQGFDTVEERELHEVAPWLRLAFGLSTLWATVGTAFASPIILLLLTPIAALCAALPFHPFDLIYNHGIRNLTGTRPLPKRGAPSRFACGLATVWLLAGAWAFYAGHAILGYAMGATLSAVGLLVSTIDVCIPSMIFRLIFGPPRAREGHGAGPRTIA